MLLREMSLVGAVVYAHEMSLVGAVLYVAQRGAAGFL